MVHPTPIYLLSSKVVLRVMEWVVIPVRERV
jgi:hypothetical protein